MKFLFFVIYETLIFICYYFNIYEVFNLINKNRIIKFIIRWKHFKFMLTFSFFEYFFF